MERKKKQQKTHLVVCIIAQNHTINEQCFVSTAWNSSEKQTCALQLTADLQRYKTWKACGTEKNILHFLFMIKTADFGIISYLHTFPPMCSYPNVKWSTTQINGTYEGRQIYPSCNGSSSYFHWKIAVDVSLIFGLCIFTCMFDSPGGANTDSNTKTTIVTYYF